MSLPPQVFSDMQKISRRRFLRLTTSLGTLGLLASYPVFIERNIILTNHYRLAVPHLPQAFSGLRIVHLTDLHYGPLVPLSLIRNVVERANALQGDLIVCTGDYVHRLKVSTQTAAEQVDAVWSVLSELAAPLGVFSVLGNHDHWAYTERSEYWLEQTGQGVQRKAVSIEKGGERLWLAGTGDYWEDPYNLDDVLGGLPASDCRIVLAHNPDSADTDFSARMDLMIAGHTHGGQVNIPGIGTPIVPVQNKDYTRGLVLSTKGQKVFISTGIGWANLPVRFNCYPEIAVLELVPEKV